MEIFDWLFGNADKGTFMADNSFVLKGCMDVVI